MNQLEREIELLKGNVQEMMRMVRTQFEKSEESFSTQDNALAEEVRSNERRINAMELKIDRDCENILALFTPVAIDLRFVMACFKINSDLERLGDNADGVAKYILTKEGAVEDELLEELRFHEMFNAALTMLSNVEEAFTKEDTKLARKIFQEDKVVNEINEAAPVIVEKYLKAAPENVHNYLYLLSIIRKLERVGDLAKNIAEETIFYIEAKVLKHSKKPKKNSGSER